jgi:ADP-ribosylation factor-binding protein GGA
MCEEESDDTEAVEKLKQINDSIRRTIERYKLVKKGDVEGALQIPKGTLGTTTGVSKNANNELSLIDLDPEPSSNGNTQGATSLEDDLLGLSFQDRPATGPVSLGFGTSDVNTERMMLIR